MKESELYNEFLLSGAIQEGHFVLSSGLHSDKYFQCAQLLMEPKRAQLVVKELVVKIKQFIKTEEIDLIVSPAIGGMILGYEVGKQLDCANIFCERVNGKFTFRRNFSLLSEQKVLLIEDVVTTAKSSLEVIELLKKHKVKIVAEASLIDRSNGIGEKKLPCPLISLLKIQALTYDANDLPENLSNIPVSVPGSRFITN